MASSAARYAAASGLAVLGWSACESFDLVDAPPPVPKIEVPSSLKRQVKTDAEDVETSGAESPSTSHRPVRQRRRSERPGPPLETRIEIPGLPETWGKKNLGYTVLLCNE